MEIFFVFLCLAIAVTIPYCFGHIRTRSSVQSVSRVILFFSIILLAAAVLLFVLFGFSVSASAQMCVQCKQTGTVATGNLCAACQDNAAGIFPTIPLTYPICLMILGIYILIFRFALEEMTADQASTES